MSTLRRKWNLKCGMLAVACLGFSYQGCSSRYKREKQLQDKLFYTNNPYKFAGYRRQEFEALFTFKTTDELDKFVKNLSIRLQTWEESDHYKALFQHVGGRSPADVWRRYRQDYLAPLEEDSGRHQALVDYHNAMGAIFENPRDHQRQQALITCHKSLSSKEIREEISTFYLQNYSGEAVGQKELRQSLLDFYLLMDFVYDGDKALEWCSAIKQVEKSLKEWSRSCDYKSLWERICENRKNALEHDPVWRYEENIRAVGRFVTLSDKLISGDGTGISNLTFDEVQSVIPYGVLLLSGHLDHLDQGDENVKRLRELCDLFRPIVMA